MIGLQDAVSDPRGTLGVLAAAFAFLLYGSFAFTVRGASIAADPTGPAALAVVHAFAAFIVLAIVAATHQLVPVLTGSRPLPPWGAFIPAAPLALGFALLIASFGGIPLFVPAALLLGFGAALWSALMLGRMISGPRERRLQIALGLAILAFAAAAAIGVAMALALGGRPTFGWLRFADAHAVLAIAGFVSAVTATISYRLVPMFALSHTQDGLLRFLPALAAAPLAAVAAGALFTPAAVLRVALAALLAAFLGFVAAQVDAVRHRLRRRLDVSLRYALVSWSFGLASLLVALGATWMPSLAPIAVLLALLGWIVPGILGYAYKIVGFLAWQRARTRFPEATLPPLADAVDPRFAAVALYAVVIGLLGSAADFAAHGALRDVPQALYCGGVLIVLALLARIVLRYRRPSCNEASTAVASIRRSPWSASSRRSTP